jgi:hypothetical protein
MEIGESVEQSLSRVAFDSFGVTYVDGRYGWDCSC